MPIYEYRCIQGHVQEEYEGVKDKGCFTVICKKCLTTMGPIITGSNRMLYFEEGRGHWMMNLGPEPVLVHSHRELEKKMREKGLEFAGNRMGTKGVRI